ncbi:hypothetical protein DVH24_021292 [Malus domestica]|uniref:Uncharacterized protein n=1 Tax=Malus domestica TaxID=3750 RepID=A0A498HVT4_MALDO|nr:hypothetical protein DVH24_021292 [Malus domestica]
MAEFFEVSFFLFDSTVIKHSSKSNWLQTPSNPRNNFAFLGSLLFLLAPCFPQPRILILSPNEKSEIHNPKLTHSSPYLASFLIS